MLCFILTLSFYTFIHNFHSPEQCGVLEMHSESSWKINMVFPPVKQFSSHLQSSNCTALEHKTLYFQNKQNTDLLEHKINHTWLSMLQTKCLSGCVKTSEPFWHQQFLLLSKTDELSITTTCTMIGLVCGRANVGRIWTFLSSFPFHSSHIHLHFLLEQSTVQHRESRWGETVLKCVPLSPAIQFILLRLQIYCNCYAHVLV